MNTKTTSCFLLISALVFSVQIICAQVIDYQTNISIDNKGNKITNTSVIIQINKKEENWMSEVQIFHGPETFSFNYARLIGKDGKVLRKLKKKELTTRNILSYQAFHQDDLITEFELYWNQFPYRIEYDYSISEEEFIYTAYWSPILFSDVPSINSVLTVNIPSDYEFTINQTPTLSFEEKEMESRKIYVWKTTFSGKLQEELHAPPSKELYPSVRLIPSKFQYGVEGSTESWADIGQWQKALNEGTDALPETEKKIIQDLIKGTQDKKEITRILYHYLQDHTTYVNVAIDVGGLKSYPASYVCRNKYGDCKALTSYMKAMLKSVGIESSYSIIHAGDNSPKIQAEFPSLQFNHVILSVPLEDDTIWLENTSQTSPFNYIGTFTQNRYALAENGSQSKLVKTPKLKPSDVLVQRNLAFTIDSSAQWQAIISDKLQGDACQKFRYIVANYNSKKQTSELLEYIDIDGFSLKEWEVLDAHRDSTFVHLEIKGNCKSPIRKIGDMEVINPLRIGIPKFEAPSKRTLDVRINFPINQSDKTAYKIKNLIEKEIVLPEGLALKTDYGQYITKYQQTENGLEIQEQFILFEQEISLEKYPDFYEFLEAISKHKKKAAIIIQ